MKPNTRLFIAFILKSRRSFSHNELTTLCRFFEVDPQIRDKIFPEESIGDRPAFCAGCSSVIAEQTYGLPTLLFWCPNCVFDKPLKYKNEWLRAGDAKLEYLYYAFMWPDHLTFLHYIDEVLQWINKKKD